MEAPPAPDYIPGPEAPPSLDYIPRPEYPEYLPLTDDVFLVEEQPLPAADGDNEKSEGDSIDYPTSRGDDDADDDDDLLEDDTDDEDEEESSDSEEEEEEHLALTVHAPALHKVERLLSIPTPPLSPVSPTSYPLPPFLMPLPIFTPLPPPPIILPRTRASMVLMRSVVPSTFILAPLSRIPPIGTPPLLPIPLPTSSLPLPLEGTPEADMPLQKRTRFTTPTGGYEAGESSASAAASTLVTQIEALQRDVSTLQGQQIDDGDRLTRHIQHEHGQRDAAPDDGDSFSQEVAYAMPRKTLRQMMTAKYCPRGEVKKLEVELWNLKVKGTDITSYTLRFQELALLCGRRFPEESDEIERYVGGLPEMIRGNVMSYEPKSMQKAIEFANDQID
nr:reverse transcriptase domain-containing protein [Tanacetum cinerariifolium]